MTTVSQSTKRKLSLLQLAEELGVDCASGLREKHHLYKVTLRDPMPVCFQEDAENFCFLGVGLGVGGFHELQIIAIFLTVTGASAHLPDVREPLFVVYDYLRLLSYPNILHDCGDQ